MKLCRKCNTEKNDHDFSMKIAKIGLLQTICKTCSNEYAKQYRDKNPEKISLINAAWRLSNPGRSAKVSRKWRDDNPDRQKESNRSYRNKNKELIAEKKKAWRKRNPDVYLAAQRRRRGRKVGADGSHTAADVKTIFDNQRGLCANCTNKLFVSGIKKFHVDHIMPLIRGGSNWPENLQCLCPTCNLRKGAMTPEEWAKQNWKLI